MIKVGITGGIGSGKTIVCQIFKKLGVPVFDADSVAKNLLNTNSVIKEQLIYIFGNNIYNNDAQLIKKELSKIIFKDKSALKKVNSIVHPVVNQEYMKWVKIHKDSKYTIKEAAILIETGTYKNLDIIISVIAPVDIRIKRIIKREGVKEQDVINRMNNQINDEERIKKSDFVITNDEKELLIPQVLYIEKQILKNWI